MELDGGLGKFSMRWDPEAEEYVIEEVVIGARSTREHRVDTIEEAAELFGWFDARVGEWGQ